ncbi:MAG: hypothetical protein ACRCUT_10480 [Spirochaetota bacterium]
MKKICGFILVLLFCAVSLFSCAGTPRRTEPVSAPGITAEETVSSPEEPSGGTIFEPLFKKPDMFNLRLCAVSINSVSVRQCYYRIFIDGQEAGRTAIGSESEEKSFEYLASALPHTLSLEKYILDEGKQRYVKLKNIEQPKPDSFAFDLPAERVILIRMEEDIQTASAVFSYDYEKE